MMHFITLVKNRAATALVVVVLAGAGLGFAPVAHADTNSDLQQQIQALLAIIAQLQAQMGQGTSGYSGTGYGSGYYNTNCVFTRDLGYGMSGPDVACLQNYLVTSGYSIPAGPTGSYYTQTQSAVAIWQAAHGVYPANGYFSLSSRTTYQTLTSGSNNNGNGDNGNNGDLRGGQASIDDYNFVSDRTTLQEDEDNRDVATIRFSPSGGDVQVNTISLRVQANDSDLDVKPWDYFDSIMLLDADTGDRLATEDVNNSSDWDEVRSTDTPVYEINFKRLNDIIREDDSAHIEILIDTDNSIDHSDINQTFEFFVPSHGIEAEDSTGRTRTAGDDSDTVRIEFND